MPATRDTPDTMSSASGGLRVRCGGCVGGSATMVGGPANLNAADSPVQALPPFAYRMGLPENSVAIEVGVPPPYR